jgi:hypothetical protein
MKKILVVFVVLFLAGCQVITPTPTATPTSTSTPTPTPTPTLTSTLTITSTLTQTPTSIPTITPTFTSTPATILEDVDFPSCNRKDYTRICPGQLIIDEESPFPGVPAQYTITGYVAEDPVLQASDNKILIAFPYSEHSHAYFYFNLGNAEDLWKLFYTPRKGMGEKSKLVTVEELFALPYFKKGAIISLDLATDFYDIEGLEPYYRDNCKKSEFCKFYIARSNQFFEQNANLLALLKEQKTGMLEVEVGGSIIITIKSD